MKNNPARTTLLLLRDQLKIISVSAKLAQMMYCSGVVSKTSGAKDTLFNGAGPMLDWHDIEGGHLD